MNNFLNHVQTKNYYNIINRKKMTKADIVAENFRKLGLEKR
jgi:hypothetical protein